MSRKAYILSQFERLLIIMDELREQCPWDKKQTMESLRTLTLEETYELTDAILDGDMPEIKKELGDVLLHLVFYARIGSETNDFDMGDVIDSLCEKLISRHPHIYGETVANDEEEVKKNWEKLKLKEGNKSVLSGVPNSLPAMVKAYRIQDKVKGVGFEFDSAEDSWGKVEEELSEFKQEEDPDKKEQEFGDLLFSLVNYARLSGINPENALERTNQKFRKRFRIIEEMARENGRNIAELSLEEQNKLWEEAKLK